jgi:CRISPR-associated protein Csx17
VSRALTAVHFEGIRVDCLGNYLAGLGLLAAISRRWPNVRGCWRRGHFALVGESLNAEAVERFLLDEWKPSPYERWWSKAQKADTKAKSARGIQALRASDPDLGRVRLLDSHLVGSGRNQFNTVFGTGGNIGKRNLAKVYDDAVGLLGGQDRQANEGWLQTALFAKPGGVLPDLGSAGTWFVYANKTFNSGQDWYREGKISPWAFLLALEGARLLRGGAGRRLGSRARPYAVFPFLCDAPSPATEGEVKLTRAEFWAPIWEQPANCAELEALLERGLARLGDRAAQAPHEFALAALSAGVDSGIGTFVRFSLRQTTSSQVFEAIPGESVRVADKGRNESDLLWPLIEWMKFLPEPPSSTKRAKFRGMRGPIEMEIIRLAERPDDAERWQSLLLLLAAVQDRLDRNRAFREHSRPVPPLDPKWFDKAWPVAPPEILVARAIASVGAGSNAPLFVNVVGADEDKWGNWTFPPSRPNRAVYHSGDPARSLAGILERRLADAEVLEGLPLGGTAPCMPGTIDAVLSGSIDLELVVRWLPAMVLLDWRGFKSSPERSEAVSSAYFLHALFRPLFHPGRIMLNGQALFREERLRGAPPAKKATTARRILYLIRSGDWARAVDAARARYLAEGVRTIAPPAEIDADGARMAAALLIPMRSADVEAGFERWMEPRSGRAEREGN